MEAFPKEINKKNLLKIFNDKDYSINLILIL